MYSWPARPIPARSRTPVSRCLKWKDKLTGREGSTKIAFFCLCQNIRIKHNIFLQHNCHFKNKEWPYGTISPSESTHSPLPLTHLTLQPPLRSLFLKARTMRTIPQSLSNPHKTVAMAKKSIWRSDVPGSRYKELREEGEAKTSVKSSPSSVEAPGKPGEKE